MPAFDAASVAALLAQLTARALGGQLVLQQEPTQLRYVPSRVPGADLLRPRGRPPFLLVSVCAAYRTADMRTPIPSDNPNLPGHVQRYDVAGGIQRYYGPLRDTQGRTFEPWRYALVCDDEPASLLVAQGSLLDFLKGEFDRLDAQGSNGRAPVRFP